MDPFQFQWHTMSLAIAIYAFLLVRVGSGRSSLRQKNVAGHLPHYDKMCTDDVNFTDRAGRRCAFWKNVSCSRAISMGLTESDRNSLFNSCQDACNTCMLDSVSPGLSCTDNPAFVDACGITCQGQQHDCLQLSSLHEYTIAQQHQVVKNCPRTCGLCKGEHNVDVTRTAARLSPSVSSPIPAIHLYLNYDSSPSSKQRSNSQYSERIIFAQQQSTMKKAQFSILSVQSRDALAKFPAVIPTQTFPIATNSHVKSKKTGNIRGGSKSLSGIVQSTVWTSLLQYEKRTQYDAEAAPVRSSAPSDASLPQSQTSSTFSLYSTTSRCDKKERSQRSPVFTRQNERKSLITVHDLHKCSDACALQREIDCSFFVFSADGKCEMFQTCMKMVHASSDAAFQTYIRTTKPKVSSISRENTTVATEHGQGCSDNHSFIDSFGFGCHNLPGYCSQLVLMCGYTVNQQNDVITHCPATCNSCGTTFSLSSALTDHRKARVEYNRHSHRIPRSSRNKLRNIQVLTRKSELKLQYLHVDGNRRAISAKPKAASLASSAIPSISKPSTNIPIILSMGATFFPSLQSFHDAFRTYLIRPRSIREEINDPKLSYLTTLAPRTTARSSSRLNLSQSAEFPSHQMASLTPPMANILTLTTRSEHESGTELRFVLPGPFEITAKSLAVQLLYNATGITSDVNLSIWISLFNENDNTQYGTAVAVISQRIGMASFVMKLASAIPREQDLMVAAVLLNDNSRFALAWARKIVVFPKLDSSLSDRDSTMPPMVSPPRFQSFNVGSDEILIASTSTVVLFFNVPAFAAVDEDRWRIPLETFFATYANIPETDIKEIRFYVGTGMTAVAVFATKAQQRQVSMLLQNAIIVAYLNGTPYVGNVVVPSMLVVPTTEPSTSSVVFASNTSTTVILAGTGILISVLFVLWILFMCTKRLKKKSAGNSKHDKYIDLAWDDDHEWHVHPTAETASFSSYQSINSSVSSRSQGADKTNHLERYNMHTASTATHLGQRAQTLDGYELISSEL